MKAVIKNFSVSVGIFTVALFAVSFFVDIPSAVEKGLTVSAHTALAFGTPGSGGCCGDDPEPEPEPEPPTYQPPQNDPDPEPEPEPKPKPVCTLNASPNSIDKGDSATLTWTTKNASSVSINQGIGSVAKNGSKSVSPNQTTTYTLTATGNGKTVTCKDTITVTEKEKPAPVCTLHLSPSWIYKGDSATLSWTTENATSVSINQGIGSVNKNDSRSISPTSNTTYTLTATGNGKTVTCEKSITVKDKPVEKHPSCDYFRANDYSIREGDTVTLSWDTTNATSVSINQGIGSVGTSGSRVVSPSSSRTYVLTVSGHGKTVNCDLHITVTDKPSSSPNYPVCREFKASDTRVDEGDRITLSWETRDADEIEIEADGDEIYNTTNSSRVRSGSITVRVEEDTTFRLTAHGERNRTDDCTVRVRVDEDPKVTITTTRDREPLTSITFTQVPYTGFGGGLAALFYALIGIFGIAVAYILVVKRGSILGFSLATVGIGPRREDIRAYAAPAAVADSPLYMPAVAMTDESKTEETTTIENRAFGQGVMLSPEALRAVMAAGEDLDGRLAILDAVITRAKETYPREDGWIALDQNKVDALFR